jgi:hypothetical protein
MPAIYQNFSKGLVQTSLGSIDPRATSATEQYTLGTELIKKDQKWRYCKNGSGALPPGKLVQASLPIGTHTSLAPAVTAIGSLTVTISDIGGAAGATANQYAGGFLQVEDGAGEGFMYRIASHPAAAANASLVITLEEGLKVAFDANTDIGLVANPWSGALVSANGLTSHLLGVSTSTVAANNYFWSQVSGPCSVLAQAALTVGLTVVRSNGAAGAVESGVDATDSQQTVGIVIQSAADQEYGAVNLTLE